MGIRESNGVGGGNSKQLAQQLHVRKCTRLEGNPAASILKKKPKIQTKAKHVFTTSWHF